jgi:hypothetical protein
VSRFSAPFVGELVRARRRGSVFVFRRVDLDMWLTGAERETSSTPTPTPTPIIPITRTRAPLSDALKRARKASGRSDD